MADEQTPVEALDGASAEELAKLVSSLTDEQLDEMMKSDGRGLVLDEIFNRMADHVDAARAAGVEAVIDWKITEGPDDSTDHYQCEFSGGAVTVTKDGEKPARVTFVVPRRQLHQAGLGRASRGPTLFMSGGLKIEGDLMFAAQVEGLFQVPKAA